MRRIVIIGGGASGILAGIAASEFIKNNKIKAEVVILEHTNSLGKKILISGKGRANLTNTRDLDEFVKSYGKNGRFLYRAFSCFFVPDLVELLRKNGLDTKIERGGRVFPISDNAQDVVKTFLKILEKNKVKVFLNIKALKVIAKKGKISGVLIKDKDGNAYTLEASKVILATGGKSYPKTGSTGDGYKMLEDLKHTITPLFPALVPLITKEKWPKDLMGLSLKNVEVSLFIDGSKKESRFGEMLFTHFGLSGPVILTLSSLISPLVSKHKIHISIDLKPALSKERLDLRLLRDFDKFKKKAFKNSLDELLPKKLIPVFVKLTGIDEEKKVSQITKEEREKISKLLKSLELEILKTRPIEEAIVTKGGVSLKEVSPSTMESKIVEGLYITGELLDIDGITGGFNLQAAFSTGYVAGLFSSSSLV